MSFSMKRAAEDDPETEVKVFKPDPRNVLIPGRMYFNKVDLLPSEFNERARSLEEILQEIRPMASIHFNFMIDFPWLIDQYPPACQNTPITLVVGDRMGSTQAEIKKDVGPRANVTVLSAHIPTPFGTHHTKLSLLEDENFIHVIVSTANLVPGDWRDKTQTYYYTKAALNGESESSVTDNFKEDLLHYLNSYNLPDIKYWLERIASFIFPANGDRLIYSFPGVHKGVEMNKVGHLSAREKLSKLPVKSGYKSRLFVLQCSSIGSLGASINTWIEPQFVKSLKGGRLDPGTSRTFVIYPTTEDVRLSIEGYAAGRSLPYSKDTARKQPWMQSVFCKWRSEKWARSRAMPHCKTYTELHDGVPQWVIMTSANLSKAAWGELQKNSTQLLVRSFEMGVLVTDAERSLLPYDYPLVKYSPQDKPWLGDCSHHVPDSQGNTWIFA